MQDYVYKQGDEIPVETLWGRAVKDRLYYMRIEQNEVVAMLLKQGIIADRVFLSNLINGKIGRSRDGKVRASVDAINRFLKIPVDRETR
jgi:hypothetical protein